MPSFDLALGHRVIGLSARVPHAVFVEPFGKIAGDVGWPVVAEQTRTLIDGQSIQARSLQRAVERGGDIGCRHGGAELPGDDVAREVVEHGREIIPTPAGDLEVGEVGLPELIDGGGWIGEACRRPS